LFISSFLHGLKWGLNSLGRNELDLLYISNSTKWQKSLYLISPELKYLFFGTVPNERSTKNHIKIDPVTLALIASALILLPLLFAGFFGQ
jgi:hypothetical protein